MSMVVVCQRSRSSIADLSAIGAGREAVVRIGLLVIGRRLEVARVDGARTPGAVDAVASLWSPGSIPLYAVVESANLCSAGRPPGLVGKICTPFRGG
jgi:hypothetical protein